MYKFITYDEPKCNTEQDLTTIGPRDVKVTFKTTKAHKQELDKLAAENGLSLSAFIVNCTKDKPFTQQDTLILTFPGLHFKGVFQNVNPFFSLRSCFCRNVGLSSR